MPTTHRTGNLLKIVWHSYQDEFDKCDAICKNHEQKKNGKTTETYYFPIKIKTNAIFIS
jgi:hypothetical protein